jgi:predicted transcriptional regulator YdeE
MGTKLVKFSVESFPKTRVIGKSVAVKIDIELEDRTIETLWESMMQDGSLNLLTSLPERTTQDPDTVGWMGDWHPGDAVYTYLAGVLVAPGTPVPDGYVYRDIDACEIAVAWLQATEGDEGGNIHADASSHINKAMQEHGYEYDGANGLFEMEYYSHERFRIPEQRGEYVILDFYSPCKKIG